ncbi:MAG: phospholipase D-like domain-containing protein [Lachnospiraceae bacterium]|nr:phospholipase D-like domain-containing protein [Lachnospiraceae bacterium]
MPELFGVFRAELAESWVWFIRNILFLNLFFSIVIIFFQRRDPKSVWTWLFALNFIPVFGVLFYLLFGQDFRKSKMFRIKGVEDRLQYSIRNQETIIREYHAMEANDRIIEDYSSMVLYNLESSGAVLTIRNDLEIFTDGEQKFEDLRQELRKAKHYIHLQYYIIKNDEVFDSIVPILLEKVKEGVEVRVLADGMGGGRFMPKKRWQELRDAGIQVGIFFPPILGRLQLRVNYRNHRKIVVIDGEVGYVGGFNIGREYISRDPKFGYWRDTHLKIRGDAVMGLQIRFALDWNYAVHENLFLHSRYFQAAGDSTENGVLDLERNFLKELRENGKAPWQDPGYMNVDKAIGIQIISSGPDTATKNIRDNYLQLFHKAKNHIYIQTPYFVPDDAILSALKIAARSGVDVRLMIPCKPDHPFVYWATYSYAGELIEAGARCYIYENGFLHAKGIMVDGMVSCYGTANMDIRSFELNFEVNAVIYDEGATEKLEQAFLDDLPHCLEITRERYRNRRLLIRIKEQFCRLLSPLL